MFQSAGKNKIAAMLAPVGLVIGLSAGVAQAEDKPVWTGKAGGVVTRYGECWQGKGGTMAENCMSDKDSDGDGVPDSRDRCPNTPKGVQVDEHGCPLDSDGDGVPDYLDKCPGTPKGAKVDKDGCEIMADLTIQTTADHFDFDSAVLKPAMKSELLEIIGHTDSTGPEDYNQGLSERRAQAAADYLAGKGVAASKMTVKGMGESAPAHDNSTREGRAMNRRVELRTK